MMQLDKSGVQEVHENEWLKREAAIHRLLKMSEKKTAQNK